jgi:hypothetical protein
MDVLQQKWLMSQALEADPTTALARFGDAAARSAVLLRVAGRIRS